MDTSLADLAANWIRSKASAKPSPATTRARTNDLAGIGRALTGTPAPARGTDDRLSLDDLRSLAVSDLTKAAVVEAFAVFSEPRSAATIRRAHSTWNGFCTWLVREDYLEANPVVHVELPKKPARQRRNLDTKALEAIQRQVEASSVKVRLPWPELEQALFALLLLAGLRKSEVVALRVGDVHLGDDPPTVTVAHGKGGKSRTVVLVPEAVEAVERYLASRASREFDGGADSRLMVRPNGKPLTVGAVDYAVRRWARQAGRRLPVGAATHALRHTFAHGLAESGASSVEMRAALGHESLQSSEEYLAGAGSETAGAVMGNPLRGLFSKAADEGGLADP